MSPCIVGVIGLAIQIDAHARLASDGDRVFRPLLRTEPAGEDDAGGWVGANPLVVCDVASHAYLLNYPARSKYVERFIEHIDWDVVAARYRAVDRH